MDGNQATYAVEPQAEERNRLTVGFRFILAIPHFLLVGTPGVGVGIEATAAAACWGW
jgi:hypothetical protein